MTSRKTLCQLYEAGESWFDNDLTAGNYLAAVRHDPADLPRKLRREDHIVLRGYGVGISVRPNGHWYFFEDIAPAVTFGRAARMSAECSGYGVYHAAHELQFCHIHNDDERVLHLTGDNVDRCGNEIDQLKRFVQAVKEHAWSSNWHEPTGFITAYNNGQPTKTRRRSLPL